LKSGCTSFRKRVANTRAGEASAEGKKGAAACCTGVRGLSAAWSDLSPNIWRCEEVAAAVAEAEAEVEVAGNLMVALGPLTPGNTAEGLSGRQSGAGDGSALWYVLPWGRQRTSIDDTDKPHEESAEAEAEAEAEEAVAAALIDDDAATVSLCPFCLLSSNTMRTLAILPRTTGDATTHLSDMSARSDRPSGPVHGQINSPVVSNSSEEAEVGLAGDLEVNSTATAKLQPQRYNGCAVINA
jgi:hypothetical protein